MNRDSFEALAMNIYKEVSLVCGCRIPKWKILLLLGFRLRQGIAFKCRAHNCVVPVDNDLRTLAANFLDYVETDEGRARYPWVFQPIEIELYDWNDVLPNSGMKLKTSFPS